jgi:hypothetical protein
MKKHIEYYFKFKILRSLHRELHFGKNPPIPEVFSQDICKYLYKLGNWSGRKADAKDSFGKAIEIKATGTKYGTTSIDIKAIRQLKDQFAGVYWLYFDLDNDLLYITFLPKIRFEHIEPSEKPRENITLSKLSASECHCDVFEIMKGKAIKKR